MDDLDRKLDRTLLEASVACGPTPSQRLRALQRLQTTIAAGSGSQPPSPALQQAPPGNGSATGSALPYTGWVAGWLSGRVLRATVHVAALGLAAVGGWVGGSQMLPPHFPQSEAPATVPLPLAGKTPAETLLAEVPTSTAPAVAVAEPALDNPSPPTPPSAAALPSATDAPSRSANSRRRLRRSKSAAPPTPRSPAAKRNTSTQSTDWARALAHLQQADEQLRSHRPQQALSTLAELARLVPKRWMEEERGVIHALSLCAVGRTEQAKALAKPLMRQNPSSVFENRLRDSCVGVTPPPESLWEEMQKRVPD